MKRRAVPVASGSLRFRWATHDDVDALVALVDSAYRGEQSRLGWTTEADLLDGQRTDREGVTAVIARADGGLLVAEEIPKDEPRHPIGAAAATQAPLTPIIGCCQLERRADGAYFGMFAIRPGHQGLGWGSLLLDEAERRARVWGAEELRMTVLRQRVELIAWYERRGFRRTGAREPFPYGDERYGLPRREDLEFVVLAKPLTD